MPHHAPAPAPNAFMDMVRAQQSFDLDRIEAEQRMKAHKAMAEGKQREKEALQTAVKNALAKRDTAKQVGSRACGWVSSVGGSPPSPQFTSPHLTPHPPPPSTHRPGNAFTGTMTSRTRTT